MIENTINKYYLDGEEVTLVQLEERKRTIKNGKIVLIENTTNQYKTLQRLYD